MDDLYGEELHLEPAVAVLAEEIDVRGDFVSGPVAGFQFRAAAGGFLKRLARHVRPLSQKSRLPLPVPMAQDHEDKNRRQERQHDEHDAAEGHGPVLHGWRGGGRSPGSRSA